MWESDRYAMKASSSASAGTGAGLRFGYVFVVG